MTIGRSILSLLLLISPVLVYCRPVLAEALDQIPALTAAQVEADWARQAAVRKNNALFSIATDAQGGCDGVKDGRYGFHTVYEKEPWWQVDLNQPTRLARICIYNRCDEIFAARASHIKVLLSDDGVAFREVYQHDGTIFLGQPDGKPLQVELGGVTARFIRLQQPGTDYLHLDEVEVFDVDSNDNIAVGKAATQSST
ncbi:MAG: discoidin domain-containing protein, partial [Candidatus Hydrogenedentales bacterium]